MSAVATESNLLSSGILAVQAARGYLQDALDACFSSVYKHGKLSSSLLETQQRRVHGLAWTATLVEALTQVLTWATDAARAGKFKDVDALVVQIGLGEYLAQIVGGLPMSLNEILRPQDLGMAAAAIELQNNSNVREFLEHGSTPDTRATLVKLLGEGHQPNDSLEDDTLEMMRQQTHRFTDERIAPCAHGWHLKNALIPDEVVAEMADLGIFGVGISTSHGGLGLGKLAMCIVSEELSRGWIGAGSLGTRSEIAGELIGANGTAEQQAAWLPKIASGAVLPTAVFTEPGAGSDLASLITRARRGPQGKWLINGAKTWITHAARSDLMTVLARTEAESHGHNGLSMFLAPKRRGDAKDDFPSPGLSGSEIPVLGYRGMREYVLSFDDFEVPTEGLLGGVEGAGFRQLMSCFESARIQTAARAIGVARRAQELGFSYARDRRQFGRSLSAFPRIADKVALMAVETIIARQLTYFAARTKDRGGRCDLEAGMAKLLGARVAWSNADTALQIHGGNGYSLEYEISRVFCDARILSIFEGAAEIQAQVIGRRLLMAKNAMSSAAAE